MLAKPDLASKGHSQILSNSENLEAIRALSETHEGSREMSGLIRVDADEIIRADWWNNFPEIDRISPNEVEHIYSEVTSGMIIVTFAYLLTGEEKYAGLKERFLTAASWEADGWSSSEGILATGKVEFHEGALKEGYSVATNEETTKTTTYLALFFDWIYEELRASERDMIVCTLKWRIDHTLNCFCWLGDRHNTKPDTMITELIALVSRSHQFEGFMDVLPAESGYSLSFFNDNAFYIHAYGEIITHGWELPRTAIISLESP